MIELKSINKSFNIGTVNETHLFDNFNFHVKKGEFVSIVGSNGSGKTTMLNLIAGSVLPDSGQVFLDGKDITNMPEYKRSMRMGRVFQDTSKGVALNMTIAENMSLAYNKGNRYGLSSGIAKKKLDFFKEELSSLGLGIEDKLNTKIGALSGGQRQSVSLIMATLTPIDVLILDEHTAALDPKTAETIMQITDKIIKEKNLTAVMVTHNLRYATEYGSRIVMMDRGNIVLDKADSEKLSTSTDDILKIFNEISIECGN